MRIDWITCNQYCTGPAPARNQRVRTECALWKVVELLTTRVTNSHRSHKRIALAGCLNIKSSGAEVCQFRNGKLVSTSILTPIGVRFGATIGEFHLNLES